MPLHVYRIGEETFIEEVWQEEQLQPQGGAAAAATTTRNPEASLAQVPASGSGAAMQQVLQTLLIQNQQLQQLLQEQEQRLALQRQSDRAWLEEKLRRSHQ